MFMIVVYSRALDVVNVFEGNFKICNVYEKFKVLQNSTIEQYYPKIRNFLR